MCPRALPETEKSPKNENKKIKIKKRESTSSNQKMFQKKESYQK